MKPIGVKKTETKTKVKKRKGDRKTNKNWERQQKN
jgi:hypothetical protein